MRSTPSLLAFFLFFASCSSLACQNGEEAIPQHPNIVLFMADDQGWGDLSSSGNTNLDTPNIDKIATNGASFSHFYVSPVCSPTRAEVLTGRYHPRGGVYSTSAGGERLDLDETTIADVLQEGGYATGAFGKWHNGMQAPYHPNARGFDEFYGFCSGHWGNYFSPMLDHNGEIVQGEGFVVDDFTNKAIQFIEANKDRPFFVYLPYNTPHSPMQVPDEWWSKFAEHDLPMRHKEPEREDLMHSRAALAMVENIDWNVGRVLNTLENLNLAENTIVIYMTDNGPNGARWNGGMRGRKGSTDEGGVRSPFYIQWKNHIQPASTIKTVASSIDILPTLVEFARLPLEAPNPLDGLSLAPLFEENQESWPDRVIYSHWNNRISLRTQQYRLDHENRLYDITIDPAQAKDIAAEEPSLADSLISLKSTWEQTVLAELNREHRPITVGHPDFTFTQMPARDAVASGGIERSNRYPNDSFFSNWTQTDEEIVWDVDVLEDGDFEVILYYTCAEGNEGSTLELSFGGNTLQGVIETPHDSPLMGAADDRVKRIESYVKDFTTTTLGTIRLTKGPGSLTLKALDIPGEEVIDFRLMMLKRLN